MVPQESLKKLFSETVSHVNFDLINHQLKSYPLQVLFDAVDQFKKGSNQHAFKAADIQTPEFISYADKNQHLELGLSAIKRNELAIVTVAGGVGTRLQFFQPKGCFPITTIKRKSLFQIFAEKLGFYRKYYGSKIPWFIMTSSETHAETVRFFEEHNYFGLSDVFFFQQSNFPVFSNEGKLVLNSSGSIVEFPNGHGGFFEAFKTSNFFEYLAEQRIRYMSYFQVDNPLIHFIDPGFLGNHIAYRSELSSKFVRKEDATEKVGLFCQYQGRLKLIEYVDFPVDLSSMRCEDGSLKYSFGSIAAHILSVDFMKRVAESSSLPMHCLKRTIENEGKMLDVVKIESFIFDALKLAQNPILQESLRGEEFSPIKNMSGKDSPQTCEASLIQQANDWLSLKNCLRIEISPKFAPEKQIFREKWNCLTPKPEIKDGLYIE